LHPKNQDNFSGSKTLQLVASAAILQGNSRRCNERSFLLVTREKKGEEKGREERHGAQ
jgi:hypothetical protein